MSTALPECAIHLDMQIPSLPITYTEARFIGSVYIFGYGKDLDLLVLLMEGVALIDRFDDLLRAGWEAQRDELYSMDEDRWFSARKGLVNLLVTNSEEHYTAMSKGADICKALANAEKITYADKEARVIIHRVLTGEPL